MPFKEHETVRVRGDAGWFEAMILKREPNGSYLVVTKCCSQMLFVTGSRLKRSWKHRAVQPC